MKLKNITIYFKNGEVTCVHNAQNFSISNEQVIVDFIAANDNPSCVQCNQDSIERIVMTQLPVKGAKYE
jgi:hypothetical protein